MIKKLRITVNVLISITICLLAFGVYKLSHPTPKRGTILRYETFKGCQVPIKADGKGGNYRWLADVPWNNFTVEERFAMAFQRGGHLGPQDLLDAWNKYGQWSKTGETIKIVVTPKGE